MPLQNTGATGAQVTCSTDGGLDNDNPYIQIGMGAAGQPADYQTPAPTGTVDDTQAFKLKVTSSTSGGNIVVPGTTAGARLVAICVGALH